MVKGADGSPENQVSQPTQYLRRWRQWWKSGVVAMLVGAIFGVVVWAGPMVAHATGEPKPVRIALSLTPLSAPFIVAIEQGYFAEFGLAPTLTQVIGGHWAAKALFNGGADIATSSEAVIMFNSFKRSDFGVFCTFVKSDNDVKLIARNDSMIRSLADLAGKRVGTTKGASSQFFLDHTLLMNQVPRTDITVVDVAPQDAASALENGDVDAVAVWEPFGRLAKTKLVGKVIEVPHDRLYVETFNALVSRKFAENNDETLVKLLRTLIKAEKFISENGEQARKIVSTYLGMEPGLLAAIWDDFVFAVALDQSLITSLEAEARWAIREALVDAKVVPNYLDFIIAAPLKAVRPESATVFQ